MVYDYFADYAKKAAHFGIDATFPRSTPIAFVAGGVGWYAYQYTMTYSQTIIAESIAEQFRSAALKTIGGWSWAGTAGYTAGKAFAPLIVPWLSPYLSSQVSLGAALSTSFSLNLLAKIFFGTKSRSTTQHLLPEALKESGVDEFLQKNEKPPTISIQTFSEVSLGSPSTSVLKPAPEAPSVKFSLLFPASEENATTLIESDEETEESSDISNIRDNKNLLKTTEDQPLEPVSLDQTPSQSEYTDLFDDEPLSRGWNICC